MSKKYSLKICTTDQFQAGTNSNVHIKFYGSRGISQEFRLNGLIKGDALERNKTDNCVIETPDDCGDIYMIDLRNSGSDAWLGNYIEITREGSSAVKFQFPGNQWLDKKSGVYKLFYSSGFNDVMEQPTMATVQMEGSVFNVPAKVNMTQTHKYEIQVQVDYTKVETTDRETGLKIIVPLSALEASFGASINKKLEQQLKQSYGETRVVEVTTTFSPSDTARAYKELWSITSPQYNVAFGDVNYNFSVPYTLIFAGFKEIELKSLYEINLSTEC